MSILNEIDEAPHCILPQARGEYEALARDGLVRTMLRPDIFVPTQVRDSPRLRAQAVRLVLGESLAVTGIVSGEGAAWIMLGGAEPGQIDVLVAPRIRRRAKPPIVLHQCEAIPDHELAYAGLRLTSPVRTAIDLARTLDPATAWAWLDRLAELGVTAQDALRVLTQLPNRRGVRRAARVLQAWGSGESAPNSSARAHPRAPGSARLQG